MTRNTGNKNGVLVRELLVDDEAFAEIICGNKTFQIHPNPCKIVQGEIVRILEASMEAGALTGRSCTAEIGYISNFSNQRVILSLLNIVVEVA